MTRDRHISTNAGPPGLDTLARGIRRCRSCPLHETRTRAVAGQGPDNPAAMLVGEAPGEEEDRQGLPFVGVTGTRFFWPLLRDAGFDPGELFITSAVKCRPPGNRDPRSLELAACRQRWLEDQVRAADPLVVVLLGRMAAIQALGRVNSLAGVRGRVLEVYGRPGLVTYHPTAGMRFPDRGRAMREDFRRLRDMVDQKPEKQD